MKSWSIAAILLPATALAFPQMNAKRFGNDTAPAPTSTTTIVPTAAPTQICQPGKYQCSYSTTSGWGWSICDVSSNWVYGGSCASNEVCTYNPLNGSPYCVPSAPPKTDNKECSPGKYQCAHTDAKGWYIDECDTTGHWKEIVDCAPTETCTYSAVHGYPYCTPKTDSKVCTPGTYQCYYDNATSKWGWQVCSAEGKWLVGGYCNNGQTCSFNPLNGSPYCL